MNLFTRTIKLTEAEKPRVLIAHTRLLNKSIEESTDLDYMIHVRYNEDSHELVVEASNQEALDSFVESLPFDSVVNNVVSNKKLAEPEEVYDEVNEVMLSDVFQRSLHKGTLNTLTRAFDEFGLETDKAVESMTLLGERLEKVQEALKESAKKPKPKKTKDDTK